MRWGATTTVSGRSMPREGRHRRAAMLLSSGEEDAPPVLREFVGTYLESARLLGQRTAALHLVLSARH